MYNSKCISFIQTQWYFQSGVTHYFDVSKAGRDFGYSPSACGDAAAWAEIVRWLEDRDGCGASREDKKHA